MHDPFSPPKIVERSPEREKALTAFIAQELERWGFEVTSDRTGSRTTVLLTDDAANDLIVTVERRVK